MKMAGARRGLLAFEGFEVRKRAAEEADDDHEDDEGMSIHGSHSLAPSPSGALLQEPVVPAWSPWSPCVVPCCGASWHGLGQSCCSARQGPVEQNSLAESLACARTTQSTAAALSLIPVCLGRHQQRVVVMILMNAMARQTSHWTRRTLRMRMSGRQVVRKCEGRTVRLVADHTIRTR